MKSRKSATKRKSRKSATKPKKEIPSNPSGPRFVIKDNTVLVVSAVVLVILVVEIVAAVYVLIRVYGLKSSEDLKGAVQNQSHKLLSDFHNTYKNWGLRDILANIQFNYSSCEDVLRNNPSASSGYYLIWPTSGQLVNVYCDMTRTCGNITGGWMRVAQLDLDNCPTGLRTQLVSGSQRSCVTEQDKANCTPVLYSSFNVPYSKVCGKIRGYSIGFLGGFRGEKFTGHLDSNFLDGIILSSGSTHIHSYTGVACDCSLAPDFVDSFTCDQSRCNARDSVCDRPVWTSSSCGTQPPYFYRQLPEPTSDDIKLRVCRDQPRSVEDVAVTVVELYVL